MDNISKEKRSLNMSRIRSKNTEPEIVVRSMIHRMGYRFRLHRHDLPGKPDIVLPKLKKVIEIRGCFWHQHQGCKYSNIPKTNTEYWIKKFNLNIARDKENEYKLLMLGWDLLVIWGCEVKNPKKLQEKLLKFLKHA